MSRNPKKTGHTIYVECVKECFRPGSKWLDAGGGHRIFHDSYDGEAELVKAAALVVICDADLDSLKHHESVTNRVCCDLSNLPFRDDSFDFVTCGMVVEHLPNPTRVLAELARASHPSGRILIHTPNLFGHATIAAVLSKLMPRKLRKSFIAVLTGRNESDIFETFYRANTPNTLRAAAASVSLEVERLDLLPSGAMCRRIPILRTAEHAYIKLTNARSFRFLRGQLLLAARKKSQAPSAESLPREKSGTTAK